MEKCDRVQVMKSDLKRQRNKTIWNLKRQKISSNQSCMESYKPSNVEDTINDTSFIEHSNISSVYQTYEKPNLGSNHELASHIEEFNNAAPVYSKIDMHKDVFNNVHALARLERHRITSTEDLEVSTETQVTDVTNSELLEMCERSVKEREQQLVRTYGYLLNKKLREQHEDFMNFSRDSVRRNDNPSSYLN